MNDQIIAKAKNTTSTKANNNYNQNTKLRQ